MSGALSTLGLGSQGVLTNDIIDQLKAADESAIIKPIERKIDLSTTRQTVLSDIKKLVTELNTQVVSLSEPDLYQKKSANLTGSSITVETSISAKEQTFNLDVKSLATRDIQESTTGYAYADALIDEQTLSFSIDGNDFTVEVGLTDTLKTLAQKISEKSDGKIEASVLNVGGTDPFKLILKGNDTGADNAITVTSSLGGSPFDRIGDAPKDAEIELDGVTVVRGSNSFDDLIEGVTLNLTSEGKTTVKIEHNSEKLVEEMAAFAEKYNAVIEKLSAVTKYDTETKSAGVFQGSSEIRNITSSINNIIGRTITDDGKTISDFGFETQRGGKIEFKEDDFKQMLKEDASKLEDFFRGTDGENGLFNKFEDALFDINTSSSGAMKSLDKSLEERLKALGIEQIKAQTRLDDRYEIMTKRFAAYDGIIGRLSSQADSISSMIEAQYAKD
jgi:flagellar hook-associated protein 2